MRRSTAAVMAMRGGGAASRGRKMRKVATPHQVAGGCATGQVIARDTSSAEVRSASIHSSGR